jgi:hypothetical protein
MVLVAGELDDVGKKQPVYGRLFFHSHGHSDGFQGIVPLIAWGCDNLVDDLYPTKDFSEYGVATVQAAVFTHANKKL